MYLQDALKPTGKARLPHWNWNDIKYVSYKCGELLTDAGLHWHLIDNYLGSVLSDSWEPYEEPNCVG